MGCCLVYNLELYIVSLDQAGGRDSTPPHPTLAPCCPGRHSGGRFHAGLVAGDPEPNPNPAPEFDPLVVNSCLLTLTRTCNDYRAMLDACHFAFWSIK